ncbi:MAG TPA: cytochrome c [Sedimenticola sp.]|nr:cytochrome c [Sedimenticola sp.]
MKIPRLLQAALVIAFVYAAFVITFDHILGALIPKSLLTMYMFFVVSGVFMVFTFDEEKTKELVAPIKALVEDPSKKMIRNLVFVIIPLGAAYLTYQSQLPSLEPPTEARAQHPAPPSTMKAFGKRFNLMTLENPLRKLQTEDPEAFKAHVKAGGEIYIQNCQYCHGDKLDGEGPFAPGVNPLPVNFQDVTTIAQLTESYLFWRIATGGPGLPKEATPWISAMPVWQNFLTEEEIWQVILFLFDYTGHKPRSWE